MLYSSGVILTMRITSWFDEATEPWCLFGEKKIKERKESLE